MQKNKKKFYITELHMGDDGLESTSDYAGPFSLLKARRILERMFKNSLILYSNSCLELSSPIKGIMMFGSGNTLSFNCFTDTER